ncbi:two-component sensor histidine kinase [Streptomyces armeniacus]|uniref:histidine kinase n=1 Tax=Streptomyces armeniacus TaxID=83291 RepID=A0A345XMC1_9ACTN|nr:histidine kinase [Streptomyces armeniacus]AXK32787.1 two-component sensor histidine kinase [Streptomyces armeniacus]
MTTLSGAARVSEVRGWLQAHPYVADALLALGTFVAVLIGAATQPHSADGRPHFGEREVHAQTLLLAALSCSTLVMRRRMPLPVLCCTTFFTVLGLVMDLNTGAPSDQRAVLSIATVVALYTVCARTDRSTSWRVGAATVLVITGAAMLFGARPWFAQENLGILGWSGLAAAVGDAVRSRRAFVDAIQERAERAERTREEEARRRVAEERMRIARELHDVVAHHIALVNVQAGVASHVLDKRPDQAKQALAHVREASRHALDELQSTVGLLRQSGDPAAPTEPAPGLGVLDELVEGFVRAGLTVELDLPAQTSPLPSAVDLTAYRVVQEALTNVQKHVGTGAHAWVRIARDRTSLEVTVFDDGGGQAQQAAVTGSGLGLRGMRERAAALHGSCEAGPLEDGGFRVHVRLPLQAAAEEGKSA